MDKYICGDKLREIRLERGKMLQEVADYIGVTKSNVGHYEHHRHPIPHDKLIKLAEYFNVPVGYFYGESTGGKTFRKPKIEFENSATAWTESDVKSYVDKLQELFPEYDLTIKLQNFYPGIFE